MCELCNTTKHVDNNFMSPLSEKEGKLIVEFAKYKKKELEETEYCGEAGAGIVKVITSISGKILRVKIDISNLSSYKLIEDLIPPAHRDACQKSNIANITALEEVKEMFNQAVAKIATNYENVSSST